MSKSKFLSLVYSLSTRFYISLVGQLMLAELFALIFLPFLNIKNLLRENKELSAVILGLFVFLLAQIFSDIFNQSNSSDYLRGWAVIFFAMISTLFLIKQFSSNIYAVVYYLFGLFLVRLFLGEGVLDLSLQEEDTNYFKVRFIGFLNPGILLISFVLLKYKLKRSVIILFFIYSITCFSFDARSTGLVYLLSSILIYIKISEIYLSRFRVILGGLFILIILYLGYVYYVNQVLNHGYGGSNSKIQLSEAKNPYNPFDLLFSGRKEVFVALYAIADKPLFGHGSWAKDVDGKYGKLFASISDLNMVDNNDFIPSHSVIFSSWLYAGIFGFFSLGFVFFILYKVFFLYLKYHNFDFITPIIIVISIEMLWHLFFSPFGHLRIDFPFFASLVLVCAKKNLSFNSF